MQSSYYLGAFRAKGCADARVIVNFDEHETVLRISVG
jgi:hypothetical protein